MTAPPDPLTVETRLRWEAQKVYASWTDIMQPVAFLRAGRVWLGSVDLQPDGTYRIRTRDTLYQFVYPAEAEARAALIAAAMEDLQYVG